MAKKKSEVVEPFKEELLEEETVVEAEAEPKKAKPKAEPKKDDKITIMLPYIEGEPPEVTVGINGVFTKIRRGVVVEVSPAVAKVLEKSNKAMMEAVANRKKFKEQVTEL